MSSPCTWASGAGAARSRPAWSVSPAPVLVYMDVDLSTGLDALLPLVSSVMSGHSDARGRIASGRRAPASGAAPSARSSRRLQHPAPGDPRCAGARRPVRLQGHLPSRPPHELLPQVEDDDWFFDTELITVAERRGLRILELPVDWVEDPDSRVRLWATAWADVRGVAPTCSRTGPPTMSTVFGDSPPTATAAVPAALPAQAHATARRRRRPRPGPGPSADRGPAGRPRRPPESADPERRRGLQGRALATAGRASRSWPWRSG